MRRRLSHVRDDTVTSSLGHVEAALGARPSAMLSFRYSAGREQAVSHMPSQVLFGASLLRQLRFAASAALSRTTIRIAQGLSKQM